MQITSTHRAHELKVASPVRGGISLDSTGPTLGGARSAAGPRADVRQRRLGSLARHGSEGEAK